MTKIKPLSNNFSFHQEMGKNTTSDSNTYINAIEILYKRINRIKAETERKIAKRIISDIFPILMDLENYEASDRIKTRLNLLKIRLKMLLPKSKNRLEILISLSKREMQIASMIKDGYNSTEIAEILCISIDTVKKHRQNIRKKIKLTSKNINLSMYLKSIFN